MKTSSRSYSRVRMDSETEEEMHTSRRHGRKKASKLMKQSVKSILKEVGSILTNSGRMLPLAIRSKRQLKSYKKRSAQDDENKIIKLFRIFNEGKGAALVSRIKDATNANAKKKRLSGDSDAAHRPTTQECNASGHQTGSRGDSHKGHEKDLQLRQLEDFNSADDTGSCPNVFSSPVRPGTASKEPQNSPATGKEDVHPPRRYAALVSDITSDERASAQSADSSSESDNESTQSDKNQSSRKAIGENDHVLESTPPVNWSFFKTELPLIEAKVEPVVPTPLSIETNMEPMTTAVAPVTTAQAPGSPVTYTQAPGSPVASTPLSPASSHSSPKKKSKDCPCPICDKMLTDSDARSKHIRRVHENEKGYECCYCEYRAFTSYEVIYHKRDCHTGLHPHKCKSCGKGFNKKSHLMKHIEKYADGTCPPDKSSWRLWKMDQKKKLAEVVPALNPELLVTGGSGRRKCTICNMVSRTTSGILQHIARDHPGAATKTTMADQPPHVAIHSTDTSIGVSFTSDDQLLVKDDAAQNTSSVTASMKPVTTSTPAVMPTATPTVKTTATPTVKPSSKPTATPTVKPTTTPAVKTTATPTVKRTAIPTVKPTAMPTAMLTVKPAVLTVKPAVTPIATPTAKPTIKLTATPTAKLMKQSKANDLVSHIKMEAVKSRLVEMDQVKTCIPILVEKLEMERAMVEPKLEVKVGKSHPVKRKVKDQNKSGMKKVKVEASTTPDGGQQNPVPQPEQSVSAKNSSTEHAKVDGTLWRKPLVKLTFPSQRSYPPTDPLSDDPRVSRKLKSSTANSCIKKRSHRDMLIPLEKLEESSLSYLSDESLSIDSLGSYGSSDSFDNCDPDYSIPEVKRKGYVFEYEHGVPSQGLMFTQGEIISLTETRGLESDPTVSHKVTSDTDQEQNVERVSHGAQHTRVTKSAEVPRDSGKMKVSSQSISADRVRSKYNGYKGKGRVDYKPARRYDVHARKAFGRDGGSKSWDGEDKENGNTTAVHRPLRRRRPSPPRLGKPELTYFKPDAEEKQLAVNNSSHHSRTTNRHLNSQERHLNSQERRRSTYSNIPQRHRQPIVDADKELTHYGYVSGDGLGVSAERPYQCFTCNQGFHTAAEMWEHKKALLHLRPTRTIDALSTKRPHHEYRRPQPSSFDVVNRAVNQRFYRPQNGEG